MKFLAFTLLLIALILEASVTTIPFILLVLLCMIVLSRENWLFIPAFIFGILLDLIGFKTLGTSSIFFIIMLFLILLYQSKFEIATNLFVLAASFLGSLSYLFLLGYNNNLIVQAVFSSIIGLLLFKSMQKATSKKEAKEEHLKA
jgi:cell shape-determining protein MreD